jgi:hypothetical protein
MRVTMLKQYENSATKEKFLVGFPYEIDDTTGATWISIGRAAAYTPPARPYGGPVYATASGGLVDGDGDPLSAGSAVLAVTLANRPAATSANIGVEVDVVDLNGGTRQRSDGTSWVDVSPGVTEYDPVFTTWANRGTGALGQIKWLTGVGNQLIEMYWDGAYWQPRTGRALLYRQPGTVSGSAGASSVATTATVTIPGDLMNIDGAIDILVHGAASASPVAATPMVTYDASALCDGVSVGTKRNVRFGRSIRNQGSASAQVVSENAGDMGGPGLGAGAVQTFTKNTAADRTINASFTATHATSIVASIHRFEVWWNA